MAGTRATRRWHGAALDPRSLARKTRRVTDRRDDPGDARRQNVLFVCSRNQWRSPTAERVWRRHPLLSVRSAGTSASARRVLTATDLAWADTVFAMEERHLRRIMEAFPDTSAPIVVLDIPDRYTFMDPELVAELAESVGAALGLRPPPR